MKSSKALKSRLVTMPFWSTIAPSLYSLNALHLLTGTDVAYIEIPKNATTVAKIAIWRLQYFLGATPHPAPVSGSYHRDRHTPWTRANSQPFQTLAALTFRNLRAFSVIRNPETRLLSAYLDKIIDINRQPTRYKQELVQRLGLDKATPTFEGFLERLQDKKLLYCDKHLIPQSDLISLFGGRTTCFRIDEPDLTNQIVRFIAASRELNGFDFGALDRITAPHPTHASTQQVSQSYTSPRSRALIASIYSRDCELFESIRNVAPAALPDAAAGATD